MQSTAPGVCRAAAANHSAVLGLAKGYCEFRQTPVAQHAAQAAVLSLVFSAQAGSEMRTEPG